MVGAVILTATFVACGTHCIKYRTVRSTTGRRLLATFRRGLVTAMVVLYSVITNVVLSLLNCTTTTVESDDGLGVEERWVVVTQPEVVCLSDTHAPAAALATVCLVVYVILFPVLSTVHLAKVVTGYGQKRDGAGLAKQDGNAAGGGGTSKRSVVVSRTRATVWGSFIDGSYRRNRFWFKQVRCAGAG